MIVLYTASKLDWVRWVNAFKFIFGLSRIFFMELDFHFFNSFRYLLFLVNDSKLTAWPETNLLYGRGGELRGWVDEKVQKRGLFYIIFFRKCEGFKELQQYLWIFGRAIKWTQVSPLWNFEFPCYLTHPPPQPTPFLQVYVLCQTQSTFIIQCLIWNQMGKSFTMFYLKVKCKYILVLANHSNVKVTALICSTNNLFIVKLLFHWFPINVM